MSQELIVTSAPRGLKPNSSGFCTVAATHGLPPHVAMKLEALSGYEFRFGLSDPNAQLNPTNFAHSSFVAGGQSYSVLSRVAFSGADHTGRTNKLAHHFVLDPAEQLSPGPAWLLRQMDGGMFATSWDREPEELRPRSLEAFRAAAKQTSPGGARQWKALAGDAGWAGALAHAVREKPGMPAFVVFEPGTELLPLFEESLAVLPEAERWRVCFATYFTSAPTDCTYHWCGILAGSTAARMVSRFPNATVIDLRKAPFKQPPPDNEYAQAARDGTMVAPAAAQPAAAEAPSAQQKPDVPVFTGFDAADIHTPSKVKVPSPGTQVDAPAPGMAVRDPSRRLRSAYGKARALCIGLGVIIAVLVISNMVTCSRLATERQAARVAQTGRDRAREDAKALRAENAELQRRVDEALAYPTPAAKQPVAPPKGHTPTPAAKKIEPKGKTPKAKGTEVPKARPKTKETPTPKAKEKPEPKEKEPPKRKLSPLKLIDFDDAEGTRKRAEVVSRSDDEIRFSVPCFHALVQCPRDVSSTYRLNVLRRGEPNNRSIEFITDSGMRTDFLVCQREPDQKQLVWAVSRSARRRYSAWVKHFVLLATDTENDVLYQCALPRKEFKHEIVLKYRGRPEGEEPEGRLEKQDARTCTFSYPWPETLVLQHKNLDADKPVALGDLLKRAEPSIVLKRPFEKYEERVVVDEKFEGKGKQKHKVPVYKWRDVKDSELSLEINITHEEKSPRGTGGAKPVTVALSFTRTRGDDLEPARFLRSVHARMDRKRGEIKRFQKEIGIRQKELASLDKKDHKRRKNLLSTIAQFRNDIKNREQKLKQLAAERDLPAELFADAPPLTIRDAWGLPVATITPKLERVKEAEK
jgi:hypothetical protein